MTPEMHEIPDEFKKVIEEAKAMGCPIRETYSRFALLQLDLMDIQGPGAHMEQMGYSESKLAVGTSLLALSENKAAMTPFLKTYQDLARKEDWVLRHKKTRTASAISCLLAIDSVFVAIMEIPARICDCRIILQMASPSLWKQVKIGDHILRFEDFKEEQRVVDSFGSSIDIDPIVLITETICYLEEHFIKSEIRPKDRVIIRKLIKESLI